MSLTRPRNHKSSDFGFSIFDYQISAKSRHNIRTCSIVLGIVAATTIPFCLDVTAVVAQSNVAQPAADTTMKMLYVNPTAGNDTNGDGGEKTPFQTITQALRVAGANTTIILSPGTYSLETGEVFPLRLKPGITIQGDPSSKGENIVIKGGGGFLSPTFAGQNIAIASANQSTITGVTVTNPNPRGYGLWIESNSPLVVDNTFTGNTHDGVSVNGKSSPTIRGNNFYSNGGNGITIYGSSSPEVRENVFQNTGFGISVGQNAAPQLIGNRIIGNKDGVVLEGKAQPILRNNVIENNTRYGLVAISQARPDLGKADEPGGNVFRANGELDLYTKASNQTIPAFGNQIASRTEGNIDLGGVATPAVASNTLDRVPAALSPRQILPVATIAPSQNSPSSAIDPNWRSEPTFSTPGQRAPNNTAIKPVPPASRLRSPRSLPTLQGTLPALPPLPQTSPLPVPATPPASRSSLPTLDPPRQSSTLPALPSLTPSSSSPASPTQPRVIDFGASPEQPLGNRNSSDLLPVPSANIPLGNIGDQTVTRGTRNSSRRSRSTQAQGLRYRVLVNAQDSRQEALVRSLVPDAFRTVANGRGVMQVGVFSRRDRANEIVQMLDNKGVEAIVEEMN
ncbi:DUF1565 domain-containing protein [Trichocoleus sp. FACHB-90]|uniref:DUF1565 domain-containing protein n=1 Tax=Cyanophyceae TaxID=3028117 RepID=UPI001684F2D7|nr:DUF1565 domain-containing protein [Trichocoleus sp. FACHB-90]